jgi:tetratricopeptide (TPR) repeat protein
LLLGLALATAPAVAQAQAQEQLITRAIDLENAGKWRDAVAAWRAVIASGQAGQGVLGLERVFGQLAQDDSALVAIDTLVRQRPTDRMLRGAQLRVLRSLGRDKDARSAFNEWVRLQPRDPIPFREFAGQLLLDGRAATADTILQEATRALGGTKELRIEVAQLRAGLGLWGEAAVAWREALANENYLEQAAQYSLQPAPAEKRDSIRAILGVTPSVTAVRKTLGMLEMGWGRPREAWRAFATLAPADSAYDTWNDFAGDAERGAAWGPARDALAAMFAVRPSGPVAARAATAALAAGEPASALEFVAKGNSLLTPVAARAQLLPLELKALSQLGRAKEVEARLAANAAQLDPAIVKGFARVVAWAWIRAGNVDKARTALASATGEDEDEVTAWIALFDGDLVKARNGLRHPAEVTPEVVNAMALLGRTKADSSRAIGAAFMALARNDSVQAAQRFEKAADEVTDAAPLLLALAARIHAARRVDTQAIPLWQRIVQRHGTAPEAAESDLEWARALKRKGDAAGAVDRLEHLILTYPQSALVPQARRELEIARTGATA